MVSIESHEFWHNHIKQCAKTSGTNAGFARHEKNSSWSRRSLLITGSTSCNCVRYIRLLAKRPDMTITLQWSLLMAAISNLHMCRCTGGNQSVGSTTIPRLLVKNCNYAWFLTGFLTSFAFTASILWWERMRIVRAFELTLSIQTRTGMNLASNCLLDALTDLGSNVQDLRLQVDGDLQTHTSFAKHTFSRMFWNQVQMISFRNARANRSIYFGKK